MQDTREIITLQFGTYANYVGAHFWNQQEANFVYDRDEKINEEQLPHNDVLYREGRNQNNQITYTPRLLTVDLTGTLGHLPMVGELYGNFVPLLQEQSNEKDALQSIKEYAEQSNLNTEGQLDVLQQPTATISEYQQDLLKNQVNLLDKDYKLSENCNSWSDFLYARYHPRSFNVLPGLVRQSECQTLGTFQAGVELWQTTDFNEEFTDRIRLFAEECDALQGFQLLFDIDDGFSGIASKCLEHLNDEYNRCNFALPLHYPRNVSFAQADPRTSHSIRVVNSVASYAHLSEQATMFTPLSTLANIWSRNNALQSRQLPGLKWQTDNLYQSSAVLAAFMDTVTLSYRLRQTPETLPRFCQRICPAGRMMTAAAMSLPLGMQNEQQDLIDYLDANANGPLMSQLSPGCEPGSSHLLQMIVARGIPLNRLKRPVAEAREQLRMAAYGCDSVSQMLQLYYQCAYHGSLTHAASTPLPLKTQLPFPFEMFDEDIAVNGFRAQQPRASGTRVTSAPVLAALQNSSKLGDHLDALHGQTHRVQLAKLQSYSQAALERDEYETALDKLLEFRDNYEDSHYL